jgi:hypothetical protein
MNGGLGVTVIDLTKGRKIELADIVDTVRLRDIAAECLPVHAAASSAGAAAEFTLGSGPRATCGAEFSSARHLWACDKSDRAEPNWALLPEGIVIGSWANGHANAALDGQGPVLPWDVLARAGVLKVGSPVAQLWAGVKPASADALACSSAYAGDHLLTWREPR